RWHLSEKPRAVMRADWQTEILSCTVQDNGLESAFGCADGRLLIWDHTTNSKRFLGRHDSSIVTCNYLKKDFLLLVGDEKGNITLWNTRQSRQIWTVKAHERSILAAAPYNEEKFIVSTGEDNKFKLWDTRSSIDVWSLSGRIPWLSRDGSLCATKRRD